MYDFNNLPAAARGYKQPGRKLKPRDSHTAHMLQMARVHSVRELIRITEAEVAAYGPQPQRPDEFKANKLLDGLSTRYQRMVTELFEREVDWRHLWRKYPRLARTLRAMQHTTSIELCIQADQQLWRNAQ